MSPNYVIICNLIIFAYWHFLLGIQFTSPNVITLYEIKITPERTRRDALRLALVRTFPLWIGLIVGPGEWGGWGFVVLMRPEFRHVVCSLNHHLFPMPFSRSSDSCILGCLLNWGLKSKQVVRTYLVILRTPSLRPFGLRGGQAQCGEGRAHILALTLCRCRLLRQFASALGVPLLVKWAGSSNCDLPPGIE